MNNIGTNTLIDLAKSPNEYSDDIVKISIILYYDKIIL
jgi:hypothetical protein